jgi:prophage regulatory protein
MKSANIGASHQGGAPCLSQAGTDVHPRENRLCGSTPLSNGGQKPDRLIGKQELIHMVGLGYTTIWKLMCEGKFPHSREIAGNRVAWLESQIDEWMKTRPMRRLKGA